MARDDGEIADRAEPVEGVIDAGEPAREARSAANRSAEAGALWQQLRTRWGLAATAASSRRQRRV